ncbi:hypothetical protein BOTBODRAFT_181720 [Botryobasidium botryosum FD-172 SS1]|uniref:Reverse transcriptase domain-containing protein n=1 Tax=Botryobasidium botryosum (strain FD-172 SS1) TaxID=930990 RepID=A0A067M447_BOTB1|nr:hypothetical protein BOTBODRAFT_181720 [Botryobasidium botryosum FD-172 SS1]
MSPTSLPTFIHHLTNMPASKELKKSILEWIIENKGNCTVPTLTTGHWADLHGALTLCHDPPLRIKIMSGSDVSWEPLSPSLSILFTSDLKEFVHHYLSKIKGISASNLEELIMYVDDGMFIIWTKCKWAMIAKFIPHLLAALTSWANTFGISIDPGKTELMYLFEDSKNPAPEVQGVTKVKIMRWLGVDYDQRLTFYAHVANSLKKATKNMVPLHVFKKLSRGVSAAAALRFYLGAIRPILTYSAPTWWGSNHHPHTDRLNSFQSKALARCLGTFRTTRTWVNHALAGVPLLSSHLNMVVELYISRVPYYFTSHPTRKLLMPIVDNPPPLDTTILDRAARYARELPLPYPVIIPPWIPTQHPRTWVVDDIRKPPPFAVENYVIPLLEAIALTGTPVLFVGINHRHSHLKIFPRFLPPNTPYTPQVFTIQLPDHSIGERTHAANLALMGALRNMPAHLLTPDLALVIANRAIVDGLTNPTRRTVYHSHLHDLASRAILACPTNLHVFVINKFHTLHPPKSAFYYRPPTYVPESFTETAPSRRVATRRFKQLQAQAFAEDLEDNIPPDHIVRTFDLL